MIDTSALVRRSLPTSLALLIAACELNPAGAKAPSTENQSKSAAGEECSDEGLLREQWGRVKAVKEKRAANEVDTASFACALAHGVMSRCPAWETNGNDVTIEICALAVSDGLDAAERSRAGRPAATSILAERAADIWDTRDESLGNSLARLRALNPPSAIYGALLARAAVAEQKAADGKKADALFQKYPTISCADLSGLATASSTATEPVKALVRTEIAERRVNALAALVSEAGKLTASVHAVETDLDRARAAVKRAAELVVEVRCHDAGAASELQQGVQRWAEPLEKRIRGEEACRATPSCVAKRTAAANAAARPSGQDGRAQILRGYGCTDGASVAGASGSNPCGGSHLVICKGTIDDAAAVAAVKRTGCSRASDNDSEIDFCCPVVP